MEVNIVTLEDDKEYIVVDAIVNNNGKYLVLANKEKHRDICIRKVIVEDGKEYIEKLDTEEEFENVMNEFYFRHKGKGEE